MSVFDKHLSDVKLTDFARLLPAAPRPQTPTPLQMAQAEARAMKPVSAPLNDLAALDKAAALRNRIDLAQRRAMPPAPRAARATRAGAAGQPAAVPRMKSWSEVTADTPGYADLPWEEKRKIRGQYVAGALRYGRTVFGDQFDEGQFLQDLEAAQPFEKRPENTWTQTLGDIGSGIAQFGLSTASIPGVIGEWVTGKPSPTVAHLNELQEKVKPTSPEAVDNQRRAAFAKQQIPEDASWLEKRAGEAQAMWEGFGVAEASRLAGDVLATLAGVGAAAKGAQALGAGTKAARAAGGAAGTLYSAGASAAGAASTIHEGVMRMKLADLEANVPDWVERLAAANGDEAQARQQLAADLRRVYTPVAAGIGAAGALVPGSAERAILAGMLPQAARGVVAGKAAQHGVLSTTARAAGTGAAEETAVGVTGNAALASIDPSHDVWDDAGGNALIGGLAGGAGGAIGGITQARQSSEDAPADNTAPGEADADTPVSDPEAAPAGDDASDGTPPAPEAEPAEASAPLTTEEADAQMAEALDALPQPEQPAAPAPLADGERPTETIVPDEMWERLRVQQAESNQILGQIIGAAPEAAAAARQWTQQQMGEYTAEGERVQADKQQALAHLATTLAAVEYKQAYDALMAEEADIRQIAEQSPEEFLHALNIRWQTRMHGLRAALVRDTVNKRREAIESQNRIAAEAAIAQQVMRHGIVDALWQRQMEAGNRSVTAVVAAANQYLTAANMPNLSRSEQGRLLRLTRTYETFQNWPAGERALRDKLIFPSMARQGATDGKTAALLSVLRDPEASPRARARAAIELEERTARRPDRAGEFADNLLIGPHLPATDGQTAAGLRSDAGATVETMAADPALPPQARSLAQSLADVFRVLDVKPPVMRHANAKQAGVLASYNPTNHNISVGDHASPATALHENLHALQVRGLLQLRRIARGTTNMAGDARALLAAADTLLRTIRKSAPKGSKWYGLTSVDEMLAEMANPGFLAWANEVKIANEGSLPAAAQRGLQILRATPQSTVLDALRRFAAKLLSFINPKAQINEDSVLDLVTRLLNHTAEAGANPDFQAALPSELRSYMRESRQGNLSSEYPAKVRNAQYVAHGTDAISAPPAEDAPQRDSTLLSELTAGSPAESATLARALKAAVAKWIKGGLKRNDFTPIIQTIGRGLNDTVHDMLAPVKRWANALPGDPRLADAVRSSLYLAAGRRDALMQHAMRDFGGDRMNKAIAAIAAKYKIPVESAIRDAGFWLTARWAPQANARLLERDLRELMAAMQAGDFELATRLEKQYRLRQEAIENPDPNAAFDKVGVAGMSNARAAAVQAAIESRIDRTDLDALAEAVYDLNAFSLTTAIEQGQSDPFVVAGFLEKPEIEGLLRSLRVAALAADAKKPDTLAALDRIRAEVRKAVRSEYVPMTGNPDSEMLANVLSGHSLAPNVKSDKRMEGRTNSDPDDGISASMAQLIRNVNYAAWNPFQDAIAAAYRSMSDAERKAAGISMRTADASTDLSRTEAIVRRRPGQAVQVYEFQNPDILRAIRGSNLEPADLLSVTVGKGTRAWAYSLTQLAPWFAPRNFIRDTWEKSELIRTQEIRDAAGNVIDGNALGRRMLAYSIGNMVQNMQAAFRFAAGRSGNSKMDVYLREFAEQGGLSVYGDRFRADYRNLVANVDRINSMWAKVGFKGKSAREALGRVIDIYNRTFDVSPALAAYAAMRDMGVSAKEAAFHTLDTANFRKRGSAMAPVNALYVFSQPAVMGGVNAMSMLINPRTGAIRWRTGVPRLAGWAVTLFMLQSLFRSMAEDDEGGNKLDQMGDFAHTNNLLIPIGDKVLKFPLAFGTTRIANGMALAMLRTSTNEQTPQEALGRFLSGSLVPVFSPIEDVDIDASRRPIEYLMLLTMPTILKPSTALVMNRTPWDTPIVFDRFEREDQYRSEQFGQRIAPQWQTMAREMRKLTGIDFAPEQIRYLIRSLPLEPLRMATGYAIDAPYAKETGRDVDSAFTKTVLSGYSQMGIKAQFYDAIEESGSLLRRLGFESEENQRRLRAGMPPVLAEMSDKDRQLLLWRQSWDEQDKKLRSAASKITKNKLMSEERKAAERAKITAERDRMQAVFLYRYRTATGREATLQLPKEFAPR